MAKYTIELRKIIANTSEDTVRGWFMDWNLSDYLTDEEIAVINEHGTFDKQKLAQQIIDHYFMREIGLETVALFKHKAKVLMREIMEEKAPLIYSAAIKYDPLINVDFVETYESDNEQNGSSQSNSSMNSNGTASGLSIQSDTPQGQINKETILNGTYASATDANESESNNTSTANDNATSRTVGNSNYTKTMRGNSGVSATAQKMVQQYRENIIMINKDIIDACGVLFMGIY